MTDQQNTAPAVWDPTARGGAGGWVRGPQQQAAAAGPPTTPPAGPPAGPPTGPVAPAGHPQPPAAPQQQPSAGAVGDQGPPLGARPYLAAAPDPAPGYDAPTARIPLPVPPQPAPPRSVPPYGTPYQQPQQPGQQPPPPPYGQGPGAAPYPGRPPQGHPQHHPQPDYAPNYAQPGYPPPDYPTGYEDVDDEDDRGGKRAPLLIGFALLFVLALGGGILWAIRDDGSTTDRAAPSPTSATADSAAPSGAPQPAPAPTGGTGAPTPTDTPSASASATPSPTAGGGPNAQPQAKALDELLTQGEGAKAPIGSAVAKVSSCPSKPDIDAAAQVFDNGAKQRDQLLTKLAALSFTDLPGGAEAVQSLTSAWQLSADVDRAYASWARAVATQGCSGTAPNTADKKRADELNPRATQAKKDFVAKWKTIADQFGLTVRTQDRI
ncbi:hypothetical protein PUR61_12600 [Streptomyces sp. BE20]|uniref:hypothetical protein n=1 Tax=Streptomyces sp. BE20 TaxID=3002525 RepID=UPI002E78B062|nr:hypothetical protein [Streptomyces sp. BE20]MEE1823022.1 hypothetical protein [Streptomyces sp. BE20]